MIELQNVTKYYPTQNGRKMVFRNLSVRFPPGASIGVLGPNGAGKSTLLRLLGGIEAPNRGRIVSDEMISWPVGLAGSFQGSLSGRDNVRFVCRMFGLEGASMRACVEFVEDFAEIGEAFDRAVKGYSSGMRSRLGFGLSMAFDFDYYLIDEVMAVGDPAFKRKSQEVFKQRLQRSKVILVSHNVPDIRALCDVVVLVRDGGASVFEDIEDGIAAYNAPAATAMATARAARGVA
ncbi:MAG: ABC transporter ATP-binding protein [Aquabacterium sp.]|nr:ABC transporter ATP-binding protein [Aquabacterium sp.]